MDEDIRLQRQQLNELKRAHAALVDEMRMCRATIAQSCALIKRSDELLTRVIIGDLVIIED